MSSPPTRMNRLSPPLMFVFRDAHRRRSAEVDGVPEAQAETPRRSRMSITEHDLRSEVRDDLGHLLGTIALETTLDLSGLDHVRRSILNFGRPDLSRLTTDGMASDELRSRLVDALMHFEPRLMRRSIEVERVADDDAFFLAIRFLIRADLICDPQNVPVEFKAEVEPQSGAISLERR